MGLVVFTLKSVGFQTVLLTNMWSLILRNQLIGNNNAHRLEEKKIFSGLCLWYSLIYCHLRISALRHARRLPVNKKINDVPM